MNWLIDSRRRKTINLNNHTILWPNAVLNCFYVTLINIRTFVDLQLSMEELELIQQPMCLICCEKDGWITEEDVKVFDFRSFYK